MIYANNYTWALAFVFIIIVGCTSSNKEIKENVTPDSVSNIDLVKLHDEYFDIYSTLINDSIPFIGKLTDFEAIFGAEIMQYPVPQGNSFYINSKFIRYVYKNGHIVDANKEMAILNTLILDNGDFSLHCKGVVFNKTTTISEFCIEYPENCKLAQPSGGFKWHGHIGINPFRNSTNSELFFIFASEQLKKVSLVNLYSY